MGEIRFNLTIHHMGKFVRAKKKLVYVGGEKHRIHNVDPDMWSYFEAVNIVKEFKYVGEFKLWWKPNKGSIDKDLQLLVLDKDAIELATYAEQSRDEVDIYVEHTITETQNVEIVKLIEGCPSSEAECEGIDKEVGVEFHGEVGFGNEGRGQKHNGEVGEGHEHNGEVGEGEDHNGKVSEGDDIDEEGPVQDVVLDGSDA